MKSNLEEMSCSNPTEPNKDEEEINGFCSILKKGFKGTIMADSNTGKSFDFKKQMLLSRQKLENINKIDNKWIDKYLNGIVKLKTVRIIYFFAWI